MWSACRLAYLWAICVSRIFANFININKGREGIESLLQKKISSKSVRGDLSLWQNEQDNYQGEDFVGFPIGVP